MSEIEPQVPVGMMCMYMPDLVCKDMRQFSLMDALDEISISAKRLLAHCMYHTFILNDKCAVYMSSAEHCV
jgi:hypothetical protein